MSTVDRIVVGVDEVETSGAAVRWAAGQARRRRAPLHLVRAVPYPVAADAASAWVVGDLLDDLDAAARTALEAATALVREVAPEVAVTSSIERGGPRQVLLEAAERAALVVTGARRRDRRRWAVPGLQLGSTSLFLAAHAPCPAVVVNGPAAQDASGVVVGVDGSPAARGALEAAAAEAAALDEPLRLVQVVDVPLDRSLALDAGTYARLREEELERARREVAEAAAQVRERFGVRAEPVVLADAFASDALLDAARGARLLVVGSRGHGAFLRALLGSTSQAVLHRAELPVLVVPDAERARRHRRDADLDAGLTAAAG